ncbi:MAG: serine protease, partial [Rhodospirillaceae bacterium]|nr:serine protease [Rhodospirillaceae bacterium]
MLMVILGLESVASDALSQRRLPPSQTELHFSFAPLVKKAAPAVVNIFTKKT